jgi:Tol biopolymer transport system component
VFQKIMGQGEMNIWVMDSDGSNARQLTANAGRINALPRVSPDGRYIVFVSERTGTAHLWRMDIDGNNPKQLTNSPDDYSWFCLDFAPDGKWVVYTRTGADGGIWKVSVEGGQPIRLHTTQTAYYPAVSPDGKMLAYYYGESLGGNGVEVISLDGNTPAKRFDIAMGPMRWTPDSRSLLYVKNEGGVSNLLSQPISGNRPKQITHFNGLLINSFDLSRDGKELVMSRGTANRDVVLIRDTK